MRVVGNPGIEPDQFTRVAQFLFSGYRPDRVICKNVAGQRRMKQPCRLVPPLPAQQEMDKV